MAKHNQSTNQRIQSVKTRSKPLKGPSCHGDDFVAASDVSVSAGGDKHARKNSTRHSSEIVSTADLISTVGQIWDRASSSLSRFQPKAGIGRPGTIGHKDCESCSMFENDTFHILDLVVRFLHVDLKSSDYFPTIVQRSLENLRPTHKITYVPCSDDFIQNLFLRNSSLRSIKHDTHSQEMSLAKVGTLCSLVNSYGWMNQTFPRPNILLPTLRVSKKIIESSFTNTAVMACYPVSGNEVSLSSNSETGSHGLCIDMPNDLSPSAIAKVIMNTRACSYSLYSKHCLQTNQARTSTSLHLGLHGDYRVSSSASGSTSESITKIDEKGLLNDSVQHAEAESQIESHLSAMNCHHPFLAKHEHAVSGALAGIVVSLFLHPIDTVKTVVQSRQAGGQTSIFFIGQSIISERGTNTSMLR